MLERLELNRFLKSIGRFGYPARPPPAPVPRAVPPDSVPSRTDNVVQLFLDDDTNQCPPGWDEGF